MCCSEPSPVGDWKATAVLQVDAVASTDRRHRERGVIEIAAPASGRKACAKPAGVKEQAYLSALPLAAGYRVEGDMFSLLTADGTMVATYVRMR